LNLKKEGKEVVFRFFDVYSRFFSIIASIAPTMTTAAIIAIPVPMMYISVGGRTTCGYGEAVGAAGSTAKLVSEDDG
jgi:hypothetical protein